MWRGSCITRFKKKRRKRETAGKKEKMKPKGKKEVLGRQEIIEV